jgi:uncharacterized protein YjbK
MQPKKYGKPPCLFKSDITFEKYYWLAETYFCNNEIRHVSYMYFDTSDKLIDSQLFNKGLRLRVRIKNLDYSLELKSKMVDNECELSDHLTLEEFQLFFQGVFPEGKIKDKFIELGITLHVRWVHTSVTVRKKRHIHDGILVIDQTSCNGKTFYQVEFRSYKNLSVEKLAFLENEMTIQKVDHRSKIVRCFDAV